MRHRTLAIIFVALSGFGMTGCSSMEGTATAAPTTAEQTEAHFGELVTTTDLDTNGLACEQEYQTIDLDLFEASTVEREGTTITATDSHDGPVQTDVVIRISGNDIDMIGLIIVFNDGPHPGDIVPPAAPVSSVEFRDIGKTYTDGQAYGITNPMRDSTEFIRGLRFCALPAA